MMKSPHHWSLAVRRPSGEIYGAVWPTDSIVTRHPTLGKPLLRGIFVLGETLKLGYRALQKSAVIALEEQPDAELEARESVTGSEPAGASEEGEESLGWIMAVGIVVGIVFFVGLFILLPTWIAPRLMPRDGNRVVFNLIEGGIRLAVFILYLVLISAMKDIRRFFQYHGAEHKSIHVWEEGLPLTAASAERMGKVHMRCGTGFLLLTLLLTVLVYSLMPITALWLRVLSRVLLIPLVAGLSYEIIKAADRHRHSLVMRAIMAPGLALQKLTTREPDSEQVEVALHALRLVLEAEGCRLEDTSPL
ncbi:MAG: DUF1385 domain-containing protein [Candidatus Geothermincolia bacterium]